MKLYLPEAQSPSTMGRVLIFSNHVNQWRNLSVEELGSIFETRFVGCVEDLIETLSDERFDACLIDDFDAESILDEIASSMENTRRTPQFICLVDENSKHLREIARPFCCEYFDRLASAKTLSSVIAAAVERSKLLLENSRLKRQLTNRSLQEIAGTSLAMKELRIQVQIAAEQTTPVLVRGEVGSGRNNVARAIHSFSRRGHRPFVKIDCNILTTQSLERELFGRATPAEATDVSVCPSRLEQAGGGSLLIDNIDSMSLSLQKKLISFLDPSNASSQTSAFQRKFDLRLICTTHADLAALVTSGRFNEDLYRRITALSVTTPPLRDRKEDIGLLSEQFLNEMALAEGVSCKRLSLDALRLLESHDWPANMRELKSVLCRATSIDCSSRLTADMIRPWLAGRSPIHDGALDGMTLKQMERKLIEATFSRCDGNRERTAQMLDIGIRTLSGKLREYGYPPRGGPGSNVMPARLKAA